MASTRKAAPRKVVEAPVETTVEQAATETPQPAPTPESYVDLLNELNKFIPEDKFEHFDKVLSNFTQRRINLIRQEMEANSAREIVKIREDLNAKVKETVTAKLAEIERAAGPSSSEDMRKLVTQEYLKFPITIVSVDDEDFEQTRNFTIREISQTAEKRLVLMLADRIAPLMQKFAGIKFTDAMTNADKLQKAIKVAPEILDITAAACVIVLNPYGRDAEITVEWVQQHVSSARQMAYIEAQFMANRIRDFFYSVSRVSQGT